MKRMQVFFATALLVVGLGVAAGADGCGARCCKQQGLKAGWFTAAGNLSKTACDNHVAGNCCDGSAGGACCSDAKADAKAGSCCKDKADGKAGSCCNGSKADGKAGAECSGGKCGGDCKK